MIAPAPRKPIPETICAAIRVGSLGELTNSLKPYADTTVNRAAPPPTSACVRSPATSSRAERSRPINAQSRTAAVSRRISSPSPSFTTIAATSIASPRSRTQPAAPSTEHGAALTNTNRPRCLARQELARRLAKGAPRPPALENIPPAMALLPPAVRRLVPNRVRDDVRVRAVAVGLGLIPPRTMHSEAEARLLARLAAPAQRVVEIGVYEGSSAVVLARAMGPGTELHLIDPFGRHPQALPAG